MKLEEQVVSLELAMKLKELGVKQESHLVWEPPNTEWGWTDWIIIPFSEKHEPENYYHAYTVAELGEMLLCEFHTEETTYHLVTSKEYTGWHIRYDSHLDGQYVGIQEHTEADARAKMLIYLIEQRLIEL